MQKKNQNFKDKVSALQLFAEDSYTDWYTF